MSADFLDNLTARAIDSPAASLAPRLSQRYEAAGPWASSLAKYDPESEDAPFEMETPSESRPVDAPVAPPAGALAPTFVAVEPVAHQQQMPEAPESAQHNTGGAPLVSSEAATIQPLRQDHGPPPDEHHLADRQFANRLDLLAADLQRLTERADKALPVPTLATPDPAEQEPAVDREIVHVETQLTKEKRVTNEQRVTKAKRELVLVHPPVATQNAPVPLPLESSRPQTAPSTTAEAESAASTVDPPPTKDADRPGKPNHAVPQVVVEAQPRQQPAAAAAAEPQLQPVHRPSSLETVERIPDPKQSPLPPQLVVDRHMDAVHQAEKTVNVSIGRIEVRAVPAPSPPKSAPPRRTNSSVMTLQDYLRRRAGGRT